MNPTRSCHSLSYSGLPEFPRRDTPASPVQTLCVHVPRGNKSDTSPRRNTSGDANRGTQSAEYPTVEGRTVFAPSKRPARPGGKAALTRLNALQSTPLVITGRRPPTWDAKAYFATEETCNLELPFGESSPFRAGRMSKQLWPEDHQDQRREHRQPDAGGDGPHHPRGVGDGEPGDHRLGAHPQDAPAVEGVTGDAVEQA